MPTAFDPKRIVIKLGTQVVISQGEKAALERLKSIVSDCAALIKDGRKIALVSSGAVGLGANELGLSAKRTLPQKQAAAAVGQSLLMALYQDLFAKHRLRVGQILLTADDFSHRERFLALSETFETLLGLGIVPIINENDTVSTLELAGGSGIKSFGDNDKLSSLVALKLSADLLLILSDVDGIYDANPKTSDKARKIPCFQTFESLQGIQTSGKSATGRGGMSSKIEAAKVASIGGVPVVIADGFKPGVITKVMRSGFQEHDPREGTLVIPKRVTSGGRKKQWIGFASGTSGVVQINLGAEKALREKHASLLPSGIIGVQGTFLERDTVSIQNEAGSEIGRGVTRLGSKDIERVKGKQSAEVRKILGKLQFQFDEVIHRDDLVVFSDYEVGSA